MAEDKNKIEEQEVKEEDVKEEVSDKKSEPSDNKSQPKRKNSKKAKAQQKKKPTPPKPYVHIDKFLQTAIPLFKMSNIQAQGFKSRMSGRHYQRDEQVFVDELKKYLNLK